MRESRRRHRLLFDELDCVREQESRESRAGVLLQWETEQVDPRERKKSRAWEAGEGTSALPREAQGHNVKK